MVSAILGIAGCYLAAGILFAMAFATWGAGAVDSAAHGSGLGFRLLIVPGSAALWPCLLIQWMRLRKRA